jgi:hypothetical protein
MVQKNRYSFVIYDRCKYNLTFPFCTGNSCKRNNNNILDTTVTYFFVSRLLLTCRSFVRLG